MNTLKQHLEIAKPYAMSIQPSEQAAIAALGEVVQATSLEAHKQMYQAYERGDSTVAVFTDDAKEPGKYISFVDRDGAPCYREFVPGNSATDIGIRGVNPEFGGVINPTTIVHADTEAVLDFKEVDAPQVVINALDAARLFNNFIVEHIAKPYLCRVAEEHDLDPNEYLQHFYPLERRAHTLTRIIMYHLDAKEGMRPVGETDGTPLLIKAHNDKSAFTIDSLQTSSGLQYQQLKTREWANAGPEIACFRGNAESYLPTSPPPTTHRVVFEEDLREKADPSLKKAEVGRVAAPTFICPVESGRAIPILSEENLTELVAI